MNGISAVVLATGNDTRAIEAGAHAYASITGSYRSLTQWECGENNALIGTIEIPMAVGIIGGATQSHLLLNWQLKFYKWRQRNA
ncbi:degradative hydroxymethylglutaryl-CoA reductase [Virgibacillus natechei]|uniref:Degradative hydroxymethylglutaryl-CoA reductase n=1 Tax=Virgibacillus natechei TaxID=1216297 RepID=A0ABS4ILG4_9BACI|nr:hypothetical protein [Virgibacillus natechei]MBP1971390.1 degradative hydroxymethylglutaryl-CoA reductase [Virgibacillus natechei]UZD12239.1 hypothetical protein OLD84_15080 [Virgibacillus natechei]